MSKVLVVGSINMDIYNTLNQMPCLGETVSSTNCQIHVGGKGYNQAVAGHKYMDIVDFFGKLGNDEYHDFVTDYNKSIGFTNAKFLKGSKRTGTAHVFSIESDNFIVLNEGANSELNYQELEQYIDYDKYSYVLLQNEIDLETSIEVAKKCRENNIKVIYNPAPVDGKMDYELMDLAEHIIVNKSEKEQLLNTQELIEVYKEKIIITNGGDGITWFSSDNWHHIESIKGIDVVDTTGAGDTFCGVFAVELASGSSIKEAITFANIASSIAIQQISAQGAMPSKMVVERRKNEISNN